MPSTDSRERMRIESNRQSLYPTRMDWTSPLRSQQASFIERLHNTLRERVPHTTGLLEAVYSPEVSARSQIEQLAFDGTTASDLRAQSRNLILESDPSLPVRELLLTYLREQLTQLTLTRAIGAPVRSKTTADYLALDRLGEFTIDCTAANDDAAAGAAGAAGAAAEDEGRAPAPWPIEATLKLRVLLCEGERAIEDLSWSYDRAATDADLVLCLWIREPVTERGNAYRVVLAGFLPELPRLRQGIATIAIGDLLYAGGLACCLKASAVGDATTTRNAAWFKTLASASNYVYPFAIGSDGKTIASSSYDGSLRIWTTENTELIAALAGPVRSMTPTSSSASHALSSDTAEKNLELWRSGSAVLTKHLVGHPSRISAVTLSPSSQLAVVGCDDGSIAIWGVKAGDNRRQIDAHRTSVKALAVSADESLLVSSATDRTLKVWDLATGDLRFELDSGSFVTISLAIDVRESLLIGGMQSGRILIWDLTDGSLLREIAAHAGVVSSLSVSPDGQQLASSSIERTIKVWDLATGDRDETLTGHPTPLIALAPQSGSKWLDLSLFQHQQPGWQQP